MPAKLSTTIAKISSSIPYNKTNCELVLEYYYYPFLEENGASERHQNNPLKAITAYAMHMSRKYAGDSVCSIDTSQETTRSYQQRQHQDPIKK